MSDQTYYIQVNLINPTYVREHRLSLFNLPPDSLLKVDYQSNMRFRSIYDCLSALDKYRPTDCVKVDRFPRFSAVMGRYPDNPESVFMWLFFTYTQYNNPVLSWVRAVEGRRWVNDEKWDYELAEFPEWWGKWIQGSNPIPQYDPHALKKALKKLAVRWWDRVAPERRNN